MGTLYLIRHGQASIGAQNYDALSDLGREQAERIGQWLARCGVHLDHAVAGSLVRQQDTAQRALQAWSQATGKPAPDLMTDPGFNEYDHHDIIDRQAALTGHPGRLMAGVSRNEFEKWFQSAVRRWASAEHDADYGEPIGAFHARVTQAVQRLQQRPAKGETVAVFSSGGSIAMISGHALGLPLQSAIRLNFLIANGSISRFVYDRERFTLSYLNSHGHFEGFDEGRLVTFR